MSAATFTPLPWQAEFMARTEREARLPFYGRGAGATTALVLWLLEPISDPTYAGVLVVPNQGMVEFTRFMLMDHSRAAAQWRGALGRVQFPGGAFVDVQAVQAPRDFERWRGTPYQRVAVDLLSHYPRRWWKLPWSILTEIDGYVGPTTRIRGAEGERV